MHGTPIPITRTERHRKCQSKMPTFPERAKFSQEVSDEMCQMESIRIDRPGSDEMGGRTMVATMLNEVDASPESEVDSEPNH